MVTVSLIFVLLNLIVGDFYFQLNALMPSCSIDTFVLKYMKYIENNNNDDAPIEVHRAIDKRAISLEVQILRSNHPRCVNIGTNQ
jgi:hypothetical protein